MGGSVQICLWAIPQPWQALVHSTAVLEVPGTKLLFVYTCKSVFRKNSNLTKIMQLVTSPSSIHSHFMSSPLSSHHLKLPLTLTDYLIGKIVDIENPDNFWYTNNLIRNTIMYTLYKSKRTEYIIQCHSTSYQQKCYLQKN
jgi:hypothetical protein